MKAKLLFLTVSVLFFYACKKDKASTKPKITITKVEKQNVIYNNSAGITLDIDIEVLDKEGDVRDSVFIKKRDAAVIPCGGNTIDLFYNIPFYPDDKKQKITFRLKFASIQIPEYALLPGPQCGSRKDTSTFSIWVKDKAGNRSDTVTTQRIAL
ncbi:MAG: hypothetical protein K2X48_00645 [Chitinophagaceae bacterium]|nr:hypothetical protein [Chitinophagaceae bacterium]